MSFKTTFRYKWFLAQDVLNVTFVLCILNYNDNNNINSNVLDSERSERAIAATMDTNRRCSYFDMWK
jgi:hypothetical protein